MKKKQQKDIADLCEVLLMCETKSEVAHFLKDLCTPQEMELLAERWRVCKFLEKGDLSYRDIRRITGASLTTIGRVSRCLTDQSNEGYRALLKKMKNAVNN